VSTLARLGIPVHPVAVVLDSAAPLGISVIADPWVMLLWAAWAAILRQQERYA